MLRRFSLGASEDGSSMNGIQCDQMNCRQKDKQPRTSIELLRLIEKGKWTKVRKYLNAHKSKIRHIVDNSGLTPLALALSTGVPPDLVDLFLQTDPDSTTKIDNYGASPLHLACLNGTTPEIVRKLINHDHGQSAKTVDFDNYTVLHHAVEYICLLIEARYKNVSDHETIASDLVEYLEIIRMICRSAPETVHCLTKDNGDTPLDIPQIMMMRVNSPHQHRRLSEVYQVLKDTSVELYRQRRNHWETSTPRKPLQHGKESMSACEKSVPSLTSSQASSSVFSEYQFKSRAHNTK